MSEGVKKRIAEMMNGGSKQQTPIATPTLA